MLESYETIIPQLKAIRQLEPKSKRCALVEVVFLFAGIQKGDWVMFTRLIGYANLTIEDFDEWTNQFKTFPSGLDWYWEMKNGR